MPYNPFGPTCDCRPPKTPELVVTENDGTFMCWVKGAPGSPVCGYGKTVLEAVGSWAIYSQCVKIECHPPELLEQFSAEDVTGFNKCPSRED